MNTLKSLALAASLSLMGFAACSQSKQNPEPTEQTVELSLTSYNVLSTDSKAAWAPRVQPIHDIITMEGHHPDVMCLQETGNPDKQQDLIGVFSDEYDYNLIGVADVEASPSLIFWKRERFECADYGYVDMLQGNTDYAAGKYATHRYANFVKLKEKATGCEFLVYNIHLKTNGTSTNYQKLRYDLISAIAPAARTRSRREGGIPVFICGDFNSYWSTVYDGIQSAPLTCKECGFTDAAALSDTCVNLQYKTSNIDVNTGELDWGKNHEQGYRRIDYIFSYSARTELSASRYWTVLDFVDGSQTHVKTPVPSDHAPVNAVYTMKYNNQ